MKMAYILARLAVSCAKFQQAMATARACGDYKWCADNAEALEMLHRRKEALLRVLRPEVIQEAREITNAPI